VTYLVDTNVLSELRKGPRAHPAVREWFELLEPDEIFLSVIVLGEIRRGIESLRRRDPRGAQSLDRWLKEIVASHEGRVLPVDARVAEEWGHLNVPNALPVVDGLLAATARAHGLTLVTRNVRDFLRTGAVLLNPFETP
jgi:hypothetical protein